MAPIPMEILFQVALLMMVHPIEPENKGIDNVNLINKRLGDTLITQKSKTMSKGHLVLWCGIIYTQIKFHFLLKE